MKLIGLLPVRNEDWCLALSLRVALMWCDEIVVLLHACTDRSRWVVEADVALEHPGRIHVLREDDTAWDEMTHREAMLQEALARGATHIAIIDADEILTGDLQHCDAAYIRATCEGIPRGHILQLPGYNLRNGIQQYHSNEVWGNRWFSVAFADDPRLSWSGDQFHAREPKGIALQPYRPIQQGQGGIMHLWGASERRLIAKHRAYRITEALRWPDKPVADIEAMYSLATVPRAPWTFAEVPESWWKPYEHLMKYLDLDAVPWQEAWCDQMIAEHGRERFAGLSV